MLNDYMDSKSQEYTIFDPTRVIKLYKKLEPNLKLNNYKIHIIGTNGKGSTGRFISQSIFESGKSVLHFTSPHLLDFRERFYFNNDFISIESLQEAHEFLQQFSFMSEASYFEYATFLALKLSEKCDFLVMETGVGGQYDSTSVINYDASIFTKIGLDHKELLGDSLESIARTKLSAADGEIFTHFQDDLVLDMFNNIKWIVNQKYENVGKYNSCSISKYDSKKENHLGEVHFLTDDDVEDQEVINYSKKYNIPNFLQENLALANLFLKSINIPLLKSKLNLRGRFEVIAKNIVLDVGHNEMAANEISIETNKYFNSDKFTLIYNSYKGKEVHRILSVFKKNIDEIIIFDVENPRILETKEMINIINNLDIPYRFFNVNNRSIDELPKNLVESSFLESAKNYLVFGSFSLAESFLCWYKDSV